LESQSATVASYIATPSDDEKTLRISREAGDKALEGFTLIELGILHDWQGEYEPALRLLEQSASIGRAHKLQYLLLRCLFRFGLARCGQGEYEAALRVLHEGLELSARLGDKIHKGRILNALGWVYRNFGKPIERWGSSSSG
jgi:tetratricopeptide (TPR) repeat protein